MVSQLSPPSSYAMYRVLQRLFNLSLSVVDSSLTFQPFWSLLTVPFHCNFCLPLGRFPAIFISATARMFSVSCLPSTFPNHSSLRLLLTIAIGSTLASHNISSFLRCSNRFTPHYPSHHSHLSCCHTLFIFN